MLRRIALLTAGLVLSTAAVSQESPAKDAIEKRHAIFELIKFNVMPLGAMARDKAPFDAELFKKNALNIAFIARMLDDAFPKGSDQGGVTDALPAIWENEADFKSKLKAFQDQAAVVYTTSKGGDLNAIKPEFGKLMESCKNCHDKYRAD